MKYSNLYTDREEALIPSLDALPEAEARVLRDSPILDEAETLVFARAMEKIRENLIMKKYPTLVGEQLVPMSAELGMLEERYIYRVWDEVATTELSHQFSTNAPLVSSSATEYEVKFHEFTNAFGVDDWELRRAAQKNIDLVGQDTRVARDAHARRMDDVIFSGVPGARTYGITNHPNVTLYSLTNGDWSTATGLEMREDVSNFITAVQLATVDIYQPTHLALSFAADNLLNTTFLDTTGGAGTKTVKQVLQEMHPEITFVRANKLNGVGTSVSRMILFRKDPEVLEFIVGARFEIQSPWRQYTFTTWKCVSRVAGVLWKHPFSAGYADDHDV